MKDVWGELRDWLEDMAGDIERVLDDLVESAQDAADEIADAMDDISDSGGPYADNDNGGWVDSGPGVNLKGRASGGFPKSGELYIARENGISELVGSWGGKAAVANNAQIIKGVSEGVAEAVAKVMSKAQIKLNTDDLNFPTLKPVAFSYGRQNSEEAVNRGFTNPTPVYSDLGSESRIEARQGLPESFLKCTETAGNDGNFQH